MIQTGYRIGMLIAGAGALVIASRAGWFAAYATVAVLSALACWYFCLDLSRLLELRAVRLNLAIDGRRSGSGLRLR